MFIFFSVWHHVVFYNRNSNNFFDSVHTTVLLNRLFPLPLIATSFSFYNKAGIMLSKGSSSLPSQIFKFLKIVYSFEFYKL